MEALLKVVVVLGGLVFSFAVALLIEELIFGQVFRMVFGGKPVVADKGKAVPVQAKVARSVNAN